MPDSADKKLLKDNSPPKPYPSPQISSFHLPSSPQIPLVSSRFVSSPPPKFHSLARSPPPSNFVVSSPLLPPNFVCLVCPAPLPQFRWPRLPSSPQISLSRLRGPLPPPPNYFLRGLCSLPPILLRGLFPLPPTTFCVVRASLPPILFARSIPPPLNQFLRGPCPSPQLFFVNPRTPPVPPKTQNHTPKPHGYCHFLSWTFQCF